MADDKTKARQEMADELEGTVAAPGVVASKSQTKGGVGGMLGLGLVGLVVGALLGLVFGSSTQAVVITAIAFAFAGGTAGVMIGGFTAPRKKLPDAGADK